MYLAAALALCTPQYTAGVCSVRRPGNAYGMHWVSAKALIRGAEALGETPVDKLWRMSAFLCWHLRCMVGGWEGWKPFPLRI